MTVFLEPARKAGLRLFAGLKAVRVLRRDATTIEGVECVRVDSGSRHVFRARQVVIAGNAVQSAALLLRSTDELSPQGLGNDHDMVGRGLCFKMSGYVLGYRRRLNPPTADDARGAGPGPFSTAAITDYDTANDVPGGIGGLIIESRPEESLRLRPDEQIIRLECLVPDQPRLDNRVVLGRGVDRFGLRDVVMDYSPHPRDRARLEYLQRRAEEILRAAGCELTWRQPHPHHPGARPADDPSAPAPRVRHPTRRPSLHTCRTRMNRTASIIIDVPGNGNLFQFVCADDKVQDAFHAAAAAEGLLFFEGDNKIPSAAFTDEAVDDAGGWIDRVCAALTGRFGDREITEESWYASAWGAMDGLADRPRTRQETTALVSRLWVD